MYTLVYVIDKMTIILVLKSLDAPCDKTLMTSIIMYDIKQVHHPLSAITF